MTENTESKNDGFGSFSTGFTLIERTNMPELSFGAFIKLVEPLTREVQEETGIISTLPMIQSAHESRNGNSGLAKEYGNLFGFKATKTWKENGKPVADLPTWEVTNTIEEDYVQKHPELNPIVLSNFKNEKGQTVYKIKICLKQEFRVYPTWRDSFLDWGRLISTVKVYAGAYKLLQRKDTVRDGIKTMASVYATDPNYARSLLALYDKVDSLA